MKLTLGTENKRLERLFKDYHEHFTKDSSDPNLANLTYHYEIRGGSGIGLNLYIVCDQTQDIGDITDYSEW